MKQIDTVSAFVLATDPRSIERLQACFVSRFQPKSNLHNHICFAGNHQVVPLLSHGKPSQLSDESIPRYSPSGKIIALMDGFDSRFLSRISLLNQFPFILLSLRPAMMIVGNLRSEHHDEERGPLNKLLSEVTTSSWVDAMHKSLAILKSLNTFAIPGRIFIDISENSTFDEVLRLCIYLAHPSAIYETDLFDILLKNLYLVLADLHSEVTSKLDPCEEWVCERLKNTDHDLFRSINLEWHTLARRR